MISLERLDFVLAQAPLLTIGLLGDLFLDRYLEIDADAREVSIETDLEAYQVARVRNSPGALGTVLNNLAALGVGRLVPVSVVGDDGEAYDLLKQLVTLPVDTRAVIRDRRRQTPTYTKPLMPTADGEWRELNRLDLRTRGPLSEATQQQLREALDDVFDNTAGLIVLDQVNEEGWGAVTPAVRDHLAVLARRDPDKLIFVDSRAHIDRFRSGVLKPNAHECLRAAKESGINSEDPRAAAETMSRTRGLPLFCTLGPEGILFAEPDAPATLVPTPPVSDPVDIVGAGDSATAGIVTALMAGATSIEAAAVGNLVASVTIRKLGTTGTASPAELTARWEADYSPA
mgnify:CR=1 FL=1